MPEYCFFCDKYSKDDHKIFIDGELWYAREDDFPVSDGRSTGFVLDYAIACNSDASLGTQNQRLTVPFNPYRVNRDSQGCSFAGLS